LSESREVWGVWERKKKNKIEKKEGGGGGGGGGGVAVTRERELSMHSQAIQRTPAHASHTMHLVR